MQREKATHQQTRSYNRQLVLRTIFDHGPISRAEVARLTTLTPVSTSQMVAELLQDSLVVEVEAEPEESGPTRRGRKPILLRVAADGRHLIALRLATNEFRGAILNMNGDFVESHTLPIADERGEAAVERIVELLDTLVERTTRPLLGIGIASPGIVDPDKGIVRRSIFFDWRHLALASILQERYRTPVHVANASQVTALAEHLFGAGADAHNLAIVRVGQDVGVGLLLDGELFFGDGFGAGELGHLVVRPDGELCRCGNRGCLETLVSRRAIVREAQALAQMNPGSVLARELAQSPDLTAVLNAYRQGDPWAVQIADCTAEELGKAVAAIVTLLNVRRILFVGSVTQFGTEWLERIGTVMRRCAIPNLARETRIEIAEHGPNAVILGAAALLMARELGLTLNRRYVPPA